MIGYVSLGAGVQSSALLVLANRGELDPAPAFAVFADTHAEPAAVYRHLAALEAWSQIPIVRVTGGSLTEKLTTPSTRMTIPAYTLTDDGRYGPLRRQCTQDHKLEPISAYVRAYFKTHQLERAATCYLGISVEENRRCRISRVAYIENAYPLVERRMDRAACFALVVAAGLPEPPKSACVYCPYRSDVAWARMKREAPADFAEAVRVDEAIRNRTDAGNTRPVFVHRSGRPLATAALGDTPGQLDLEFGAGCDGGHCGA